MENLLCPYPFRVARGTQLRSYVFLLTVILLLASSAWAGPMEDAAAANARGDYAAELRIIRPLAAKGEAWAQLSLGDSYRTGEGVPKNDAEAVKWWKLAQTLGCAFDCRKEKFRRSG